MPQRSSARPARAPRPVHAPAARGDPDRPGASPARSPPDGSGGYCIPSLRGARPARYPALSPATVDAPPHSHELSTSRFLSVRSVRASWILATRPRFLGNGTTGPPEVRHSSRGCRPRSGCAGRGSGTAHGIGSDRREARVFWSVRYSCSIRSTNCDTPSRWPSLACCSTVRQSSANAAAPSVEPFDFSVCAARRSSSVSCRSSELRRLVISRGASARKTSTTSARKSTPPRSRRSWSAAASRLFALSPEPASAFRSGRARFSAAASSSRRIGFAR